MSQWATPLIPSRSADRPVASGTPTCYSSDNTPVMSQGWMNAAAFRSPIDASSFPHIVDSILHSLCTDYPLDAVRLLRVCKAWHHTISSRLFEHLSVQGSEYGKYRVRTDQGLYIRARTTTILPRPLRSVFHRYVRVLDISRLTPDQVVLTYAKNLGPSAVLRLGRHSSQCRIAGFLNVPQLVLDVSLNRPLGYVDSPWHPPKSSSSSTKPSSLLIVHSSKQHLAHFVRSLAQWPVLPGSLTIFYHPDSPQPPLFSRHGILTYTYAQNRPNQQYDAFEWLRIHCARVTLVSPLPWDEQPPTPTWLELREHYGLSGVQTSGGTESNVRFLTRGEYRALVGEMTFRLHALNGLEGAC